ncbi:hypothetical protein BZA77DRAFT_360251 [Pyronema omphalodes]|nr:hypothetical protein BZA77DRAFT_360251 [Pyronema omphalodes]
MSGLPNSISVPSIPAWDEELMRQLARTAADISNLCSQIQNDEGDAVRMLMNMQTAYVNIQVNLDQALQQTQQQMGNAVNAQFNLTNRQFIEVAEAYTQLQRQMEDLQITRANDEVHRQVTLESYTEKLENNQQIIMAYYKAEATKQEEWNASCGRWAAEFRQKENDLEARMAKDKQELKDNYTAARPPMPPLSSPLSTPPLVSPDSLPFETPGPALPLSSSPLSPSPSFLLSLLAAPPRLSPLLAGGVVSPRLPLPSTICVLMPPLSTTSAQVFFAEGVVVLGWWVFFPWPRFIVVGVLLDVAASSTGGLVTANKGEIADGEPEGSS